MIELTKVVGLATVQDGGRPGWMHAGVPRGGPMSPDLLAGANAAVENAPGVAAIEAFGDLELVAVSAVRVATDARAARQLSPGELLRVRRPPELRVHYIALRGGVDVPRVLGGRGTLLVGSLGGHEGRPLRAGDALRIGNAPAAERAGTVAERTGAITVVRGPDRAAFDDAAFERLLRGPLKITPASDRTGTRLAGPALSTRGPPPASSTPMIRGAIEITPDGGAIVLGPDHPTTGGYPVLACVTVRDFGRFMQLPIGAEVRFAEDEARSETR